MTDLDAKSLLSWGECSNQNKLCTWLVFRIQLALAEKMEDDISDPLQCCADTAAACHLAIATKGAISTSQCPLVDLLPNNFIPSLPMLSLSMPVCVLGFHIDTCGEGHGHGHPTSRKKPYIVMLSRYLDEQVSFCSNSWFPSLDDAGHSQTWAKTFLFGICVSFSLHAGSSFQFFLYPSYEIYLVCSLLGLISWGGGHLRILVELRPCTCIPLPVTVSVGHQYLEHRCYDGWVLPVECCFDQGPISNHPRNNLLQTHLQYQGFE